MTNLYEIKNYILNKLGLNIDDDYVKLRRAIVNLDAKDNNINCLVKILLDIIDFEARGHELWSYKNTLPFTYHLYHFIIDTFGRSQRGIEESIQIFSQACLELGISKVLIHISGNWSHSSVILEKVLVGFYNHDWTISGIENRKLVLETKEE